MKRTFLRLSRVAFVVALGLSAPVMGASGVWTNKLSGTWGVAGNWAGGTVADGAGATAWFTNDITAIRTITNDSSRTLGILNIGDSVSSYFAFNFVPSGGATLTFSTNGARAQLNQTATANAQTLGIPLILASPLDIANASAAALTISNGITGSGNLTFAANKAGGITLSTVAVNPSGAITNSGLGVGSTTISGGVGSNVTALTQASTGSALSVSGNLAVNINGTMLANTSAGNVKLTVSGGVRGAGDLMLNNNSAVADGITLSGLAITNTGRIVNSGSGSSSTLISAVIGTNVTSVTQNSGTSQLTLGGVNTFAGGLFVKAGTVASPSGSDSTSFGAGLITLGDTNGSANAVLVGGLTSGIYTNPIAVVSNNTGVAIISNTAVCTFKGPVSLYAHDLLVSPAGLTITLSGGVSGTGSLTLASAGVANVLLQTGIVDPVGTITNSGLGTGTTTISGGVGSNVTTITEASATSALTVSGNLGVNSNGTTLANISNAKALSLSGGVSGSGDLVINNNGSLSAGIAFSGGAITHAGRIINSGLGTGSAVIGAGVGTNVTAITQASTGSTLTVSGNLGVNSNGTTLANTSAGSVKLTVSGGVRGAGDLVLNNNSAVADGITLSGLAITNTGRILNSGSGSGSTLLSAVIGANVTSVIQASGTSLLTLGGGTPNLFAGGLFVRAGTVAASGDSGNFGAGLITLGDTNGSANVTLLGGVANANYTNAIAVSSNNTGVATISNSAASTFSGLIALYAHDLLVSPTATALTLSGGMTGTGNLTLATCGAGPITLSTRVVNPAGTITNSGLGTGTATLSGGVGSNVTVITEASTGSALTVSGNLAVNSNGTTLINNNAGGVKALTVSGGVRGVGDLVLNNNSAISEGILFGVTPGFLPVTNTGRIINSGTGSGSVRITSAIGATVTGLVQNSASSMLILSGVNTFTGAVFIKAGTIKSLNNVESFGADSNLITLGDTSGSADAEFFSEVYATYPYAFAIASNNTGIATISSANAVVIGSSVSLYDHDLTLSVLPPSGNPAGLTLSGGITGRGNLTFAATDAYGFVGTITISGKGVDNSGVITNASPGTGLITISGGVGSNVTAITQASASSPLTITTSNLTVNSSGTTLANNSSGSAAFTVSSGVNGTGNLVLKNNTAMNGGLLLSTKAITNVGWVVNSGTGSGNVKISAVISPTVTRVVQSSATSRLILSGANAFSGETAIDSGTLHASNTTGSATGTGAVNVNNGGTLQDDGIITGPVNVNSGGTLDGDGTISGTVTNYDGGTISPGIDGTVGGVLTVGSLVWNGGGTNTFEVDSIADDGSGQGHYDRLLVNNTLTAVPGGKKLVIRLDSLGHTLAFDTNRNYSLKLITCGTSATLDTADVELDTTAFLLSASGTWTVTNLDKSIWVTYRSAAQAGNNYWIGSGNWSTDANWSLGHAPQAGEAVEFDGRSAAVCAANAVSNNLKSITLAAGYTGTVTFASNAVAGGMNLTLSGDLEVREGALVFSGDTTAVNGGTVGNPFGIGYTIQASNVVIASGASINADDKGFPALTGPGKPVTYGGASYGGQGGVRDLPNGFAAIPPRYGSPAGPTALGSGGYKTGGGAIQFVLTGRLSNNGLLSADATVNAGNFGGGSGGSIWISGGTIEGSGVISASGGPATASGGGGGRIDISGTVNQFTGSIRASGGTGNSNARGLTGSILLPQADLDNFTPVTDMAFGNSLAFGNASITNGVTVSLDANTNENLFTFTTLVIGTNSAVVLMGNRPAVNAEAGGTSANPYGLGVTVMATTLTINAGGSLNADGQGFYAAGPGGEVAHLNGSASYGGLGGDEVPFTHTTSTYGSISNVTALGSGGSGGAGGGAMRVIVSGVLTVEGTNSCNGQKALSNNNTGSGGSLWIDCDTVQGVGWITANGGDRINHGAGGGGRVHLTYRAKGVVNPIDNNRVIAYGGFASTPLVTKGAAGTVLVVDRQSAETSGTLIIDNDAASTNWLTTLLPTNSDCFVGTPPRVTVDRVVVRGKGVLELPADKMLAVVSVFSNGATFLADSNSTVAFVGTNEAVVYGPNVFENLRIADAVKTVRFEAGKTNTVTRGLILNQAALRSTTEDAWWYLNSQTGAVQNVLKVQVKDSNASGGKLIIAGSGSSNWGNNVNWSFVGGGTFIMIR